MELYSSDESKINITENQKKYNDYVSSLKIKKKLSIKSAMISIAIVLYMIIGTLFFNMLKFPWFLTMILILLGVIGAAALNFNLEKNAFKDTKCPLCNTSLNSYQKDRGKWYLECIKCNLSAYTGYRGMHGGEE